MITQKYNIQLKKPDLLIKYCDIHKILFFDIETTGLSPKNSFVYLISAGYFTEENNFRLIQFFAENMSEEIEILTTFDSILDKFIMLSHFNGDKFDIPYLKLRLEHHGICSHISTMESLDIYVMIKQFKNLFGLINCKLKTIEKFLSIKREDLIDGGEAIDEYYNYVKTKDQNSLKLCLLHNYEDVLNLPKISQLLIFDQLKDLSGFKYNYMLSDHKFTISVDTSNTLDLDLHFESDSIALINSGNNFRIVFKIQNDRIKCYYSDYKKYVFLNSENYAVESEYAKTLSIKNCEKCTLTNSYHYIRINSLDKMSYDDIRYLWNENYGWIIQSLIKNKKL